MHRSSDLKFGLARGSISRTAFERVGVYDASGRRVRTLETRDGRARWDGRDDDGGEAPPGLYFVRWRDATRTRTVRAVRLPG